MKSKNFNAAEKHFAEKKSRYRKELKALRQENSELTIKNKNLAAELSSKNTLLAEKDERIDRLLVYTEIDKETLSKKLKTEQQLSETLNTISVFTSAINHYN